MSSPLRELSAPPEAAVRSIARASLGRRTRDVLARAARKLSDTTVTLVESRRMERIRRDPARLIAALRSAKAVLIVCEGNIIRSPFTARLVRRELGDQARISVSSAGLGATPGTPPPPTAFRVAARLHVDLGHHTAAALTSEAVAASDVIFVMDLVQLRVMRTRFPEARAKAFLLTSLAPEAALEVRDPFGGDEAAFQACYEHISKSVRPIVRLLAGRGDRR
jgi:protein-tyrosine phosphatase